MHKNSLRQKARERSIDKKARFCEAPSDRKLDDAQTDVIVVVLHPPLGKEAVGTAVLLLFQHVIYSICSHHVSWDVISFREEQDEGAKRTIRVMLCLDKRRCAESSRKALFQASLCILRKLGASHDCWGEL